MSKAVFRRMLLREEMGRRPSWGSGALCSPSSQFQLWRGTRLGWAALPHSGCWGDAQFFPRYFCTVLSPPAQSRRFLKWVQRAVKHLSHVPKKGQWALLSGLPWDCLLLHLEVCCSQR